MTTRIADLVGQARVVAEVRRLVDAWRGFELGRAEDAYPPSAPRYAPVADDERPVSETTLTLLHHWFRSAPHDLPNGGAFRYWPHQRWLVETFIYLQEVRGLRRTEDLYKLTGVDSLGPQRDPWAKLGGNLAQDEREGAASHFVHQLLLVVEAVVELREPDRVRRSAAMPRVRASRRSSPSATA